MFKKSLKIGFGLIVVLSIGSVLYNFSLWLKADSNKTDLTSGWYSYDEAFLSTGKQIYRDLTRSFRKGDRLFISMFLWPYEKDDQLTGIPDYNIRLARLIRERISSGEVCVGAINFDYLPTKEKINNNVVVKTADNLDWHVIDNPYAIPSNLLLWPIINPITHYIVKRIPLKWVRKYYCALRVCSIHQKVVVINEGESAWMGSRNFNRKNWNNEDNFLFVKGDIAKKIFSLAARSISEVNLGYKDLEKKASFDLPQKRFDLFGNKKAGKIAKALNQAEIKPALIRLIRHSKSIDMAISLLCDPRIIGELNSFVSRGGRLRIVLDPNKYIFGFKLQDMPNIIAFSDIAPQADIRIFKTDFQMHTKSVLFTLENGSRVFFCGTSNFTAAPLVRFSYNDIAMIIPDNERVNRVFEKDFERLLANSEPREGLRIEEPVYKYNLSKALLFIGFNPW